VLLSTTTASDDESDDDLRPAFPENGIDGAVASVTKQIKTKGDFNPVEILRCLQQAVVIGRPLEIDDSSTFNEGQTTLIFVDRQNILETGLEEVHQIKDLRFTLEVQFYGEVSIEYICMYRANILTSFEIQVPTFVIARRVQIEIKNTTLAKLPMRNK
jgi:hypothetical protein